MSRTIVHRTRPGLGCALERLRTSTARRELQAQLLGPAASGFARGAEQMAAEDPKAEEFITVIHDVRFCGCVVAFTVSSGKAAPHCNLRPLK